MPLLLIMPFMTMALMFSLVTQRKHLLMALLSLEAMILSLAFFISSSSTLSTSSQSLMILFILTLGACEASLGLATLVLLSRSHSTSNLNSLTTYKC